MACGFLVPDQGSNLWPWQWKHIVLTTDHQGSPPDEWFLMFLNFPEGQRGRLEVTYKMLWFCLFDTQVESYWCFPGDSAVKSLPGMQEMLGDAGSIPGSGRSPGGGHGNPLQATHSCPENPMHRGAWRATVHRVRKNLTQLKWLSVSTRDRLKARQ